MNQTPYFQRQEFTAYLGDQAVRFISKPGLPHWDEVSPSARLLAEQVVPAPQALGGLLNCGHGAWAAAVARRVPRGKIWLLDTSIIALELAHQTLQMNALTNFEVIDNASMLPALQEALDFVAIDLPKGRKLAQRWLAEAWHALRPGGYLYLGGAKDEGIQSVVKDAEALFSPASILGYKKGCRAVRLVKRQPVQPPPAWLAEPGTAPGSWDKIQADLDGACLELYTLPGVFSSQGLDGGTRLLLAHLSVSPGERVLDAGCGCGVIGLAAAQKGAGWVDLVDANLLACAAARKNLAAYQVSNAQVYAGDVLQPVLDRRYSLVATNPPFHTGKEITYQITQALISQARQLLEPGGRLLLVANQFIRYDQVLEAAFGRVRTIAHTRQYHLLEASV